MNASQITQSNTHVFTTKQLQVSSIPGETSPRRWRQLTVFTCRSRLCASSRCNSASARPRIRTCSARRTDSACCTERVTNSVSRVCSSSKAATETSGLRRDNRCILSSTRFRDTGSGKPKASQRKLGACSCFDMVTPLGLSACVPLCGSLSKSNEKVV